MSREECVESKNEHSLGFIKEWSLGWPYVNTGDDSHDKKETTLRANIATQREVEVSIISFREGSKKQNSRLHACVSCGEHIRMTTLRPPTPRKVEGE